MRCSRLQLCCLAMLAVFWIVGCGDSQPRLETIEVQGTLQIDGNPLGSVKVVLSPQDPGTAKDPRPSASGMVGEDGSFELGTYSDDDGIPLGKYYVTLHFDDIEAMGSAVHTKPYTAEITKPADGGTLKLLIALETDPNAKGGVAAPELGGDDSDGGILEP